MLDLVSAHGPSITMKLWFLDWRSQDKHMISLRIHLMGDILHFKRTLPFSHLVDRHAFQFFCKLFYCFKINRIECWSRTSFCATSMNICVRTLTGAESFFELGSDIAANVHILMEDVQVSVDLTTCFSFIRYDKCTGSNGKYPPSLIWNDMIQNLWISIPGFALDIGTGTSRYQSC